MPLPKHEHTGTDSNRVSYNNLKDKADVDDAVSKKHTQNADTALGAQTENLDMNTNKIVGVVDPTADQEAATKKYVDDNSKSFPVEYIAGDTVLVKSQDGLSAHNGTSYTKLVEITIVKDGELRIKFDIHADPTYSSFGRIYVNGSPIGTEQENNTTSYVTYSEDISGLKAGDLVQLYTKSTDVSANVSARNYRLYATVPEISIVSYTL